MDFIPKSKEETEFMLEDIGIESISELFSDIPEKIRLNKSLNLPKELSEADLKKEIEAIAKKNRSYKSSFLGAGSYSHYIPSIIDHIISRSEFYTAYTPYQAEMSQGILQAIFEYQTMICNLTGMDVSNASVYDGAEALAEAAIISLNKTKKSEIIISKTAHPEYRETVRTYLDARDKKLIEIDFNKQGKTDFEKLKHAINENTAGILIQSPNFFGNIEDIKEIEKITHNNKSLLTVAISDPSCLGILIPPGDLNADIVIAEGQSFGNPKSFGGPYLGIIAVKQDLMRYIPGRIAGQTIDKENNIGYTLTLQAREQHIRREKASCNICSNEALNALAASVYLASLGKQGIKELASLNLQKSHYASEELKKKEVKQKFEADFYNEFVIEFENKEQLERFREQLEKNNIEPGLSLEKYYPELENCMLLCVTEMNSKQDIDKLVNLL
ncbi:MAG: aminomethyl-transferring glycine dehydrogenase subunit GcvPA [Nanoarchaeota archaeon]|nr:aminomethyl-transferring glycine dehydrogenase subunit GcvPA [Nanoarchaeota archaeon]